MIRHCCCCNVLDWLAADFLQKEISNNTDHSVVVKTQMASEIYLSLIG